jgi:phage/plasmid-like protein (TIGR03299 family)
MAVIQIEEARTETGLPNPFSVLGTDVSAAGDVADVLTQANLRGWNVRLREMQTVSETITPNGVTAHPTQLRVPDSFAVIRDSPFGGHEEIIGTVGNKYTPRQNEQIEETMEALVGESAGKITAAGDFYGNGKQVFFTIELPVSARIGGVDVLDHNLSVFTGHDGSMSTTFVISSIRPMCANMRSIVLSNGLISSKVRHTKNSDAKLALVHSILGLGWESIKKVDEKADAMANQKLADDTFWEIVNQIWEPKDTAHGVTLAEKRRAELTEILHGPTNANIDGTVWAGFNTITQYLQHGQSNSDEVNARRALRSQLMPTSDHAKLTANAEARFLALV